MGSRRRAHDKDGRVIPPATVGSELAQGYRLAEIWCEPCCRHVEVAIDGLPADLAIPDIASAMRYRCSVCGGRQLTSRMSIAEFYRVAALRRAG